MLLHNFNKSNAKNHACTYIEFTRNRQRNFNLRNLIYFLVNCTLRLHFTELQKKLESVFPNISFVRLMIVFDLVLYNELFQVI